MKIQLNTNLLPIFSGTYENIWDITEYDDNGEEWGTVYDHQDLMRGIAQTYQNHNEYIKSEFDISFLSKINFVGSFYSPREYNFSTDSLDFEITVNKSKMLKELKSLKDDNIFHQYLKDNFTSYDGFMSFTPNNYSELYDQIKNEGQEFEQSIGAFLTYLIDSEKLKSIEESIYDDWQGNGYGGTDYHVECWKCDTKVEYPFEHICN